MSYLRITAGTWRNRRVKVIGHPSLRPTPDRVRETLFNWLGYDLSGLFCLDLFAGSGILGFEAASRGAREVTLVEKNNDAFKAMQANATLLDPQAQVLRPIKTDALQFSNRYSQKAYDIIFLDPPYWQGWLEKLIACFDRLAHRKTRIYAEAESPITCLGTWHVSKCKRAGQVYYHLLDNANS